MSPSSRLSRSKFFFAVALVLCGGSVQPALAQGTNRPRTPRAEMLAQPRPMDRTQSSEVVGTGARYSENIARGFVPRHENFPGRRAALSRQPELMEEAEVLESVPPGDIGYEMEPAVGSGYGPACGGCGNCGTCCMIPCPRFCWDNFSIFGGVQGFTGPPNRGSTGSFGFHEGVNYGSPLPCTPCGEIGWQLGTRLTHSNFSGAEYSLEQRNQVFVTGGLFRRVDWGLQGGVVYDWLHENWYHEINVGQIRGELSWVYPCKHEFGFWFASNATKDRAVETIRTAQNATVNWTSTDLYAFFYRRRFGDCDSGSCRIYAGFSGDHDGLIGADGTVAICDNLAFQAGFTYLIPEQSKGAAGTLLAGHAQEGWNLAMSLVWYPGCGSAKSKNYYRPLFNVADNGSFMLDRL